MAASARSRGPIQIGGVGTIRRGPSFSHQHRRAPVRARSNPEVMCAVLLRWLKARATFGDNSRRSSMPQLQVEKQPVTQITIIESEPDKQAEALSVMTERARFMARQPGFISISLHRSLDGRRIVNYVQWQTRDQLRAAHQSPEFRKQWRHFDELTEEIDPHLYEVSEVMDGGPK
jgi:heme-degrading monooxygenase HmoA